MPLDRRCLGVLLVVLATPAVQAQTATKALPTPPVPGKSLPVVADAARVERSFPAPGIATMILRAGMAEQAEVTTVPGARVVTVSGVPTGGAAGYHPADPNWRETPAAQWGQDFQARLFGTTLVISSIAEIQFIHHVYHLEGLRITVPEGVRVVRENRELTGEHAPDLAPPAASPKPAPSSPG